MSTVETTQADALYLFAAWYCGRSALTGNRHVPPRCPEHDAPLVAQPEWTTAEAGLPLGVDHGDPYPGWNPQTT